MAFKFCPQCGTGLDPGGRFCGGCGAPVGGASGGSSPARLAGLVSLATLLALGGGFWLWSRFMPAPPRPLKPGEGRAAAPAAPPAGPAAAPAAAAGTADPNPHQKIDLPDDIKQYIAGLAKDAEAKPKDLVAWQTLARVYYRAARIDPSYADRATAAYERVLQIDPKDLEGLRGLANVAYDRQDRTKAIEYYGRYLDLKPDDPEVRTDLGTMFFESGDKGRAMIEYQRVLEKNPKFFQAWFNMAVLEDAQGNRDAARKNLEKARDLATEDPVKQRISSLLAATAGGKSFAEAAEQLQQQAAASAPPAGAGAPPAVAGPDAAAAGAAANAAAAAATTYKGAVEALFRGHAIAGPKVVAVDWPAEGRVRITMNGFPMAQMPEVMRNGFLDKMKRGAGDARARFAGSPATTIEIVDQSSGEVMATIEP
jgi:tetratricopeptide (TPR) repeat protein